MLPFRPTPAGGGRAEPAPRRFPAKRHVTEAPASDGFRPDLEGLRGIAVILVLLYHAGVPGTTGGYVGVDVFFVLSGFLITGLLVRERQRSGTISLPAFYARRARRLLPAAALCLLVTVALSAVVLPPLRVPDVAADGVAAALYASNLRFAFEATDYLRSEAAPSPLLHYWSLGVEEQFYVFWPALVLLISRAGDVVRRVAVMSAVVLGLSFVLSLWLTTANAPWAFYSLPTRAWELAIGALLAVGTARIARLPDGLASVAGWIGLAMVGASAFVIGTTTPFPGTAAILPTVGSGLVILSGMARPSFGPQRLLGEARLRFMGRISYSLYLWHWPVIVLPAAAVGSDLPLVARVGLALLAIPIAAASQRWVEDPIRHGRFVGILPRRNLALAGALTVVLVASLAGIGRTVEATIASGPSGGQAGDQLDDYLGPVGSGTPPTAAPGSPEPSARPAPSEPATPAPPSPDPARFAGPVPANLTPSLLNVADDKPVIYGDGCHADQATTEPKDCAYGDPDGSVDVVLIGDSHAAQWFPALDRLGAERGWRVVPMTKSGCSAADITTWNATLERAYSECDTWREAALGRIEATRPDLVVMSTSRGQRPFVDGQILEGTAATEAMHAAISRTLERLRPTVGAVAMIADTPRARVDPPVCLSDHLDDVLACATAQDRAIDEDWLAGEVKAAKETGTTLVDPIPWVCPADPCPVVIGRFLVFRDTHHLTTPFATALRTRLEAALPLPASR